MGLVFDFLEDEQKELVEQDQAQFERVLTNFMDTEILRSVDVAIMLSHFDFLFSRIIKLLEEIKEVK